MADAADTKRAKFTPGPWGVDFGEATRIRDDNGSMVAMCSHVHLRGRREPAEVEANARLIAAAPAMYEALKRAEWTVGALIREHFPDGDEHVKNPLPNSDLAKIRAALASAQAQP